MPDRPTAVHAPSGQNAAKHRRPCFFILRKSTTILSYIETRPSLPVEPHPMPLTLRYSPASPFVRKVLVFAHETGLAGRLTLAPTDVWAADSDIFRDNPLGKVPALTGEEGSFIGSLLCCEYLDTLHHGKRLIPTAPPERWTVLRLHALADGVIEAAVARVVEVLRRPPPLVYQGLLERQADKIRRTLDLIERAGRALADDADLGTITLGCALGYLDFRLPQLDWRAGRPALAEWQARFAERPSMTATAPRL
jgi:glutathione S-transferase